MALTESYKKSTFSGNCGCVEVGVTEDTVYVRDSKDTSKPPHVFTRREWQAFLDGVRNNEFDL